MLLALLMTFGGVAIMNSLESSKMKTARSQALEFSKAVEMYRLDNNRYPTSSEGWSALLNPARGLPYLEKMPKDPWGNSYIYISPGIKNINKYDIKSLGPD